MNLVVQGSTISGGGYLGPGVEPASPTGTAFACDYQYVTQASWVEEPGYTVTVSGDVTGKQTAELTLTSAEVLGSVASYTVTVTASEDSYSTGPNSWANTGNYSLNLLWPDGRSYVLGSFSPTVIASDDAISESCNS